MSREDDLEFMRLALRLAARGKGFTSPNPAVGAVIVKDGLIIGRGWHRRSGEAHAEAQALAIAGRAARGATMYVTMEPCSTFGRTPPCTNVILNSGLKRVVVATRDPNPRHRGRGIALLRRRGIRVDLGPLAGESSAFIEDFAKYIKTGLPFTIIKAAMTLDGKIATVRGDSRWISCPSARRYAHRLRLLTDAVLVGRRTAERDDPLLTVRLHGFPRKVTWRIVLDSTAKLPLNLRIFQPGHSAKTIIAVTNRAPRVRVARMEAIGAKVLRCRSRGGMISLRSLCRRLGKMGIMSLLIEGGGEVIASALEGGLVDKVVFFISPKIFGGRAAPTVVEGEGARRVADAIRLSRLSVKRFGDDLMIEGRVRNCKL